MIALYDITVMSATALALGLLIYRESYHRARNSAQKAAYDRLLEETCEGWILLEGDKIIEMNPCGARYLGMTDTGDWLGTAISRFFPRLQKDGRPSLDHWKEHLVHAEGGSGLGAFSWQILRQDGDEVEYEIRLISIPYPTKKRLLVALRDNAHQRLAAEAHHILMSAVDRAPAIIVITDSRGNIRYANHCFTTVTGYSSSEVHGRNIKFLQSGLTPRETYRDLWNTITAGKTWKGEFQNRRKDGSLYWEAANIAPVMDDKGIISSFVAVKEDITLRKTQSADSESTRTAVLQSRKLEGIGTLAGGIAHDFNNFLSAIIGYAELIKMTRPVNDTTSMDAGKILVAACRARDLVRQIQLFSGKDSSQRVTLNLLKVIDEASIHLRTLMPGNIAIEIHAAPGNYTVFADPAQMHQVIMNLATNAIHAMGTRGGTFSITLRNCVLTMHNTRQYHGLLPGHYLELIVRDTGEGMNDEVRERIFEPFFTTKPRGEGTGMGLAVLHGIVMSHQGHISVDSKPGQGSAFTILLPLSGDTNESPASGILSQGTGEEVLLVDHHEPTANAHARLLEEAGYRVSIYHEPSEALRHFSTSAQRYQAALVDCASTTPSNSEIIKQMRTLNPLLPIVVYTVHNRASQDFQQFPSDVVLLPKPASAAELLEALGIALKRA
ncbi:MAG: PAS domain S-box protein [Verrucomicrobiota bacterium]|nr:PAS domain S-box protein [Verrucomicrobiota bacterium]